MQTSLRSLKGTQEETFSVLPTTTPPGLREDSLFSGCVTLEELRAKTESENIEIVSIPYFTVLRCALASGKLGKSPTAEDLFKSIEEHLPEFNLASDVGLQVGAFESIVAVCSKPHIGSTMGNP